MFNKRLINELKDAKDLVVRQVFYQWIALMMNILFTIIVCFVFYKLIVDSLSVSVLLMLFISLIALLSIRGYCLMKANQFSFQSASYVKRELREKLYDKVYSLGIHYTKLVSTSELVQLSVEGIEQLETYFSMYLPQLFYSLLAPVTLFIVLSFFDLKSSIALIIAVPLIPLSIVLVQKLAKKLLFKYWSSYTSLGDSFLENLQGLTTLKIYGSDKYKQEQMNREAENFRKITMRVLIMQLNSISIMDIVAYGGAGIGCYIAIMSYMNDSITLFSALLVVLLSFEFFIPLRQLGSFFHIAMNGIAASDKIFRILDYKEDCKNSKELENVYDIKVNHLYFAYDDREVLKDINIDISKNQFIGIVGESGSGKSTFAKVIMGFYDYNGSLCINGIERSLYSDKSFLEKFVYVTYDPMIFKGSLKDNLCLAKEYDDEFIWDVLEMVRLDDFFKSQNGLETLLLEGGSNLSGGQKQRLNLARALLYDGDVYIFDEATSNIDVESEEMILNVISTLSAKKTVIMITHRLSNVEYCDSILVLKDGKIAQKGHHNELKQSGVYSQLLKQQKELEDLYG